MVQFINHHHFQFMNGQSKILRVSDLFIVAVIIVGFLVFWFLTHRNSLTGYVEVYKDGRLITVLKQDIRYELKSDGKHIMDIVFDGKRVHVENSDCPLKICEKTGEVGPNGVIVCIPNKVVVRFVGKNDVDVMTW